MAAPHRRQTHATRSDVSTHGAAWVGGLETQGVCLRVCVYAHSSLFRPLILLVLAAICCSCCRPEGVLLYDRMHNQMQLMMASSPADRPTLKQVLEPAAELSNLHTSQYTQTRTDTDTHRHRHTDTHTDTHTGTYHHAHHQTPSPSPTLLCQLQLATELSQWARDACVDGAASLSLHDRQIIRRAFDDNMLSRDTRCGRRYC